MSQFVSVSATHRYRHRRLISGSLGIGFVAGLAIIGSALPANAAPADIGVPMAMSISIDVGTDPLQPIARRTELQPIPNRTFPVVASLGVGDKPAQPRARRIGLPSVDDTPGAEPGWIAQRFASGD